MTKASDDLGGATARRAELLLAILDEESRLARLVLLSISALLRFAAVPGRQSRPASAAAARQWSAPTQGRALRVFSVATSKSTWTRKGPEW